VGDLFTDGAPASRSAFTSALLSLQQSGQQTLDDLASLRQATLLGFEQSLTSLYGRQQRIQRVLSTDEVGKLVITDLLDIDQARSNTTIRSQSASVTLPHRIASVPVVTQSQSFSVSSGSLDTFGQLYQVTSASGAPTGTYQITLAEPANLSLLVFDLVMAPAQPVITVRTSDNGVSFQDAVSVSVNGYQVTAFLTPASVRTIQISITPAMPDNLGGSLYTFGLMNFFPYELSYQLAGELDSKAVTVAPTGPMIALSYTADPRIAVFYSWDNQSFAAASPGMPISVPGAITVVGDGAATADNTGRLTWKDQLANSVQQTPSTIYPNSVVVADSTGNAFRRAPGLDPTKAVHLTVPVVTLAADNSLYLLPASALVSNATYSVSYQAGPAALPLYFRIQFSTDDRSETPVFSGITILHP
jgi:hypothetical protein